LERKRKRLLNKARKGYTGVMGITISPRFITDTEGHKIDVVLSLNDFNALIKIAEELEDVKAFDEAMKNPEFVDWEETRKDLGV
jgi:hypothetical protein